MKLLFFLCFFISLDAFSENFKVIAKSIYPPEAAEVAKGVVISVKNHYSKKMDFCFPEKGFDFNEEYIDFLKNRKIIEVRVEYYSDNNLLLTIIFSETKTELAVNVSLKNNKCNEFIFYKAQRWTDPPVNNEG